MRVSTTLIFFGLLCGVVAASSSSTGDTVFRCAGEFQQCPTGECVLIADLCGKVHCPAAGMYLCPDFTTCVDDFATCPNLRGTFWDYTLPVDTRVELLANLTNTTEQIAQLTNAAPAIPHLYVPEYNWLNDDLHGLRRHRATSFPNGCGLGATWDPDTLKSVGSAIGSEARALHHWFIERGDRAEPGYQNGEGLTIYGPNINLVRDPRWGRAQEVYSEDPLLSSKLVKGIVAGMQETEGAYKKTAACCKHFAVYDLESDPIPRYFYNAVTDGRNLWETYLPVFEACVREAQAAHVMCSYNSINGIPACAQEPMLNGVLRGKWNWTGFVVSDYDAWAMIYTTHFYCPNMTCAASTGLNAGMDQEGGGTAAIDKLAEALAAGQVTTQRIAQAFKRLFRVRFELGMFDPPSLVPWANLPFSTIDDERHLRLSLHAARQSIGLYLNNNATLPLPPRFFGPSGNARIAVVGPNAAATYWLQGNYAESPAWGVVSVLEGLFNASCGADTPCQFDAPSYAYHQENDTFVPSSNAQECCSQCRNMLHCNYFTFDHTHQRCYFLRNQWNRFQTSDTKTISGGRPGLALMAQNLSFVASGDYSVSSHDERECSQRCRADPNCNTFTYLPNPLLPWLKEHTCFLNPTGELNVVNNAISGGSPPKCASVSFTSACEDGMRCQQPFGFSEAVERAQTADAVVLVLGLDQEIEAEGMDRATIDLPDNQYELAKQMAEATAARNTSVICVLVHGGTIALKQLWTSYCDAIVDAWYPSQQGGNAVADVLLGWYNPGSRATVTYYNSNTQLPPTLAYQDLYPNATAGLLGYTYRYFTGVVDVPFGHGLSYTTFSYSNLSAPASVGPCDEIMVTVSVTNVGDLAGDEVVQLYVQQQMSVVPVPNVRLADFKRIHLRAGETQTVSLSVSPKYRSTVYPSTVDPILGSKVFVEAGTSALTVGGGQPAYYTGSLTATVTTTSSANVDHC